jgi:hypothetical protein
MFVGKAPLYHPRAKEITAGQLALESFLARRRQKYQARRASESVNNSCEESILSLKCDSVNTSFTREARNSFVHERNCVVRLASLSVKDGASSQFSKTIKQDSPYSKVMKLKDLSQVDCEELARHVVSRAKVRLKRRKKAANVLQKIYRPTLDSSSPSKPPPPLRTSTPTNSNTPKTRSPSKPIVERLNKSLDLDDPKRITCRKVLRGPEKQPVMAADPGVPPTSSKP